MSNLELLILSNNRLVYVSDSIGMLQNLFHLNLERNQLNTIPETIGNCTRLQLLKLSFNQLESVPDELASCIRLRELYLYRAGSFIRLPNSYCGMRFLEYLYIDPLVVLPLCWQTQKTDRLIIRGNDL